MKFNFKKFQDRYTKLLYKNFSNGLEVRVTKYPFHSGLRVQEVGTIYKIENDIHCKNVFQVIKELKRILKREAQNEIP